jgi:putative transposase
MPTRNTRKIYGNEQYYHIYTRGINKQHIFHEVSDFEFFISLFKRYLSNEKAFSPARVSYAWYGNRIDLVAYCLMSNHVHLLMYQHDNLAMPELMHSIFTSYSMYYNQKYKHFGPVFQSRYLASLVDKDNYLEHVSRYIHLNPKNWKEYEYSSIRYYLGPKWAEWIKSEHIMKNFKDPKAYFDFLEDYEGYKQMLDELKFDLAHE